MAQTNDTAGVIAPPPLLLLIAFLGGLAAHLLFPLTYLRAIDAPVRWALGALLIVAALALSGLGVRRFSRAGTPVEPWRPVAALVTDGIFAHVRNPMYLGFLLVLLGWAAWLGNPWTLIGPVVFVLYMNRFQIGPEERALAALFGEEYSAYRAAVRRWI